MSAGAIVLALFGTGGLSAIVGALINGGFNRRKLGAEATEVLTKAASGLVERIDDDNTRLRLEVADERRAREADKAEFTRIIGEWRMALQLHVSWDELISQKFRDMGMEFPDPPPLYPPSAKGVPYQ